MALNNKKISRKRERRIAVDIKGKAHLGSGAAWYNKGDVSSDLFHVEDKFTRSSEYSLSYTIFRKIQQEVERKSAPKIPVLSIGFISTKKNYAIMRKQDVMLNVLVKKKLKGASSITICESDLSIYFLRMWAEWPKSIVTAALTLKDKEYYIFEWDVFVKHANKLITGDI